MKLLLAVAALTAAFTLPNRTTSNPLPKDGWVVDGVHSSVVFKVQHGGASWFDGTFNTVSGAIVYDAAKPEDCSFEIEIDPASVDTRNEQRDKHLRGPDFFDCKQYPSMTFKSSKVHKDGDALKVEGTLSAHGVEKPATAVVHMTGTGEMMGKKIAGFEATLTIKRSEFGMEYGLAQKALGDEVHLTIAVEANPAEAKK